MSRRQASLLIELVVVVAIIALLGAAYLGLNKRGKPGEKSMPKAAMDKSRTAECAAYLQQMRALVQMKVIENDQYPPKLEASPGIDKCPLTGAPYSYDPQSGRVWCTTPGHEKL